MCPARSFASIYLSQELPKLVYQRVESNEFVRTLRGEIFFRPFLFCYVCYNGNVSDNHFNAEQQQQLKDLDVGIVYLFGSHAEGLMGPMSDVDVAVVFRDPKVAKGDTTEIYGKLYDLFADVFDLSGFKDMDIVFLERAGLELKRDVITHGKVLFEISPEFRFDFEERTMLLAADFQPILKEFDRAVLERI